MPHVDNSFLTFVKKLMTQPASSDVRSAIACPFCGMACDDLDVRTDEAEVFVLAKGCARSVAMFRLPLDAAQGQCFIDGKPVELSEAVARAAAILGAAHQPLVGGLGADVAGARAALQLANRIGAVVDHMNSRALMRNLAVLQDSGWVITTFAEVQNRADLVVVVGTDVVSRFPRFFERVLGDRESMFTEGAVQREMVYLGTNPESLSWRADQIITCNNPGEAFAALRALLGGRALQCEVAGGIPVQQLQALAERMRAAKYGVLVWAAADLDFAHAELHIQAMCNLVADLNVHTRFAVLPLGGSDGDITANQVTLWQTGFPLRVGFGAGSLNYDPLHYSTERLLKQGEADALLWISAFDAERRPPACNIPVVVFGRPGMRFSAPPAVYIPVAVPGIHHAGHFFRSDSVVALRLRKLIDSSLPAVADVLGQIERML